MAQHHMARNPPARNLKARVARRRSNLSAPTRRTQDETAAVARAREKPVSASLAILSFFIATSGQLHTSTRIRLGSVMAALVTASGRALAGNSRSSLHLQFSWRIGPGSRAGN